MMSSCDFKETFDDLNDKFFTLVSISFVSNFPYSYCIDMKKQGDENRRNENR